MFIREATATDLDQLVPMGMKLWPDEPEGEIAISFQDTFTRDTEITYICHSTDDAPIGFAILSLRSDYVEGSTQRPTGYLEAIFVDADHRGTGIAKELVLTGQLWCRYNGCSQIASDVELDNTTSQAFHEAIGFRETNRLVTYIQDLD